MSVNFDLTWANDRYNHFCYWEREPETDKIGGILMGELKVFRLVIN